MKTNNTKPTKSDLERRMRNALVLVPRDKDYQSIYFDDKGLKLEVTQDFAVISTGFHQHIFRNITAAGISRPYLYTKRFIEISTKVDCVVKDAKGYVKHSYSKLMAELKKNEDKSEYNLCWFYDLWLNNIFHPLYGIGETETEAFLVYESYMHNVARNQVILSEKINDLTNLQFIDETMALVKKFTEGMEEKVIFVKKTDEEKTQEEIEALQEQQQEKVVEEQANGSEQ